MRYYIASKLENAPRVRQMRDHLNNLGHQQTYDWTTHGPVYGAGLQRLTEVSIHEINGVLLADVVIVLWPGGRGTHVELGAAIAANKRVAFISPLAEHHSATAETCAFYHHPLVTRFTSIAHFMTSPEIG